MYDLGIVGGGPGGYVCALRGAQLGLKVVLFEEAELGGTCLNRGCIPTKALLHVAEVYQQSLTAEEFGLRVESVTLDYAAAVAWKDRVVSKLVGGVDNLLRAAGVDVVRERAEVAPGRVLAGGEEFPVRNIVLATGSRPAMPPIEGRDLDGVITSDGALSLSHVPRGMVVIGGGVIGVELACLFAALGCEVTLIEMERTLLPTVTDAEVARRLTPALKRAGIKVVTGHRVQRIEQTAGGLVVLHGADPERAEGSEAELVLIATGRVPDFGGLNLDSLGVDYGGRGIEVDSHMRTSVPGVYAVGDVTGGPLLAHVASHEGMVAAENVAGRDTTMDYSAIPAAVFSTPEIASVGLTEQQLKEKGVAYKKSTFSFAANGRALCLGQAEGVVKLLAEEETGRLLGAHLLGPGASELIHEVVVAMRAGLTASDIKHAVHAHPTLSEAIAEAAFGFFEGPLHQARRGRR